MDLTDYQRLAVTFAVVAVFAIVMLLLCIIVYERLVKLERTKREEAEAERDEAKALAANRVTIIPPHRSQPDAHAFDAALATDTMRCGTRDYQIDEAFDRALAHAEATRRSRLVMLPRRSS